MGIRSRPSNQRLSRRDFLGLCGSASSLLLPAPIFGLPALGEPLRLRQARLGAAPAVKAEAPPPYADFRIVPHYPAHSPLEELIRKARQKEDDFPSERFSRAIETELAQWASELRKSPKNVRMLAALLSPRLAAASPRPQELREIRGPAALKLQRASFSTELSLDRGTFLEQFQSTFEGPAEITIPAGRSNIGSTPSTFVLATPKRSIISACSLCARARPQKLKRSSRKQSVRRATSISPT